ncbi:hypothetical protein [Streptomyces sp. NPDC012510]|uniref:hypothetical protein n=1 Tax=Streptomyces sp. NPDC012510 TaxID=3364838 RepID=UPI0036EBC4C5
MTNDAQDIDGFGAHPRFAEALTALGRVVSGSCESLIAHADAALVDVRERHA